MTIIKEAVEDAHHLQQKRVNVFDVIPAGFFNYLASNSNQRLYVECLELIYRQYEREISYCIPRNQIRASLAIYLLENHVCLGADQETGPIKTHGELASAILRKFCSKNVGWLEEENEEATYEKQILMTERGILLAEFLTQLKNRRKKNMQATSSIFIIRFGMRSSGKTILM